SALQPRPALFQEISGSLRERPRLLEEMLSFTSRNIHAVRFERVAPTPVFEIRARVRSVEGFTLQRAAAIVSGGGIRRVRGAPEIATDGRDHFAVHMITHGESDVFQLGRQQRVTAGCYALIATSEPFILEGGKGLPAGGISFLMPSEFVNQRV